jgi:hypothetical protein
METAAFDRISGQDRYTALEELEIVPNDTTVILQDTTGYFRIPQDTTRYYRILQDDSEYYRILKDTVG